MGDVEVLNTGDNQPTYIFLDTCIVFDCAYTRVPHVTPSLLDTLLDRCRRNGVKLLVPEVVLLELNKVAKNQADILKNNLQQVKEYLRNGALYPGVREKLQSAVSRIEEQAKAEANETIKKFRDVAIDPARAMRLPLVEADVLEAAKMSIAGQKPSKPKGSFGLVQGDCLIIAGLQRFMGEHTNDRLVICSSNTTDFACGEKAKRLLTTISRTDFQLARPILLIRLIY